LSGWFWGDPHFKTLDGGNYTFNGVGEYTMVVTNSSEFVLQARTKVAQGGLSKATVFSAGVAKEVNTSKVEVRVKSGGTNYSRPPDPRLPGILPFFGYTCRWMDGKFAG